MPLAPKKVMERYSEPTSWKVLCVCVFPVGMYLSVWRE